MTDLPRRASYCDEEACHAEPGTHVISFDMMVTPDRPVTVALLATIVGETYVEIQDRLVEVAELLDAVTATGEYAVFACGCACPDCPGVHKVRVEVDKEVVWWRWYRPGDRPHHREAVRTGDIVAAAEFAPCVAAFTRAQVEQTVVAALEVRAVVMRALRAEGIDVEALPPPGR